MDKNIYCKRCKGEGGWIDYDSKEDTEIYYECPDCDGTGMLLTNKINKHEEDTSSDGNQHPSTATPRDGGSR